MLVLPGRPGRSGRKRVRRQSSIGPPTPGPSVRVGPLVASRPQSGHRDPAAIRSSRPYRGGVSSWIPPNRTHPPPKPGEPPLHRAARLGDHDQIRALVQQGAAVDQLFEIQLDPGGRHEPASPLMVAAGSSDGASAATLSLLLELGASVQPQPGLAALIYACVGLGWNYPPGGDADRVALLLSAGADPQVTAPNGASTLACAARSGDPERVRLLLEAGVDPMPDSTVERAGHRILLGFLDPLLMAAESGSALCLRLLLDAGADVHRYPGGDKQLLSAAASLDALETLLGAGAEACRDESRRRSVVEAVARNGRVPVGERVRMLQALDAAGADLNQKAPWATPLFGAAMEADDEAVEALLAAGADPLCEPTGLVGICFSAQRGPDPAVERVIDLLVAAGLDPDELDAGGLRPLHAALAPDQFGPGYAESDGFNEPAALALIRLGVTIDIMYPDTGYRPLHAAAAAGSAPVVAALLQAGAKPTDRAADGTTPLDIAHEAHARECAALLEPASSDTP